MYRQRMHFFPKTFVAWNGLMTAGEEFNKLAAEKGWTQATLWMPTVGESELVWEADYPDLATFQRETEEQFTDPDAMAVFQKLDGIEMVRTGLSELLQTAPSFA